MAMDRCNLTSWEVLWGYDSFQITHSKWLIIQASSKRDVADSEIEAIFKQLDLNNDQSISFVEFARKFQLPEKIKTEFSEVVHMNQNVERDYQNLIDAFEVRSLNPWELTTI